MFLKILMIVLLILIAISLFSGLFFLIKDEGKSNRVVTSLTWRVGLSLLLFITVIVAYYLKMH